MLNEKDDSLNILPYLTGEVEGLVLTITKSSF